MITLPEKFKRDTEGKDTYLVPLVIINETIALSTQKVNVWAEELDMHFHFSFVFLF